MRTDLQTEQHPLQPFLPPNARILMLGSFPPPIKRWCMDFYYPNFQNDMWRIVGHVFFDDKLHFVNVDEKIFCKDSIIRFLLEKGIALYDTASAVRRLRDNASDKFLEVVVPTNVNKLLEQIPQCKAVVVTGQKAAETLAATFGIEHPKVGHYTPFCIECRELRLYRMPSSSRAYPMSIEKKAAYYRQMYADLGLLEIKEK